MSAVTASGPAELADLGGRLVVCCAFTLAAVLKLADLRGLRGTLYVSRVTRPWVRELTVLLPVTELVSAAALLGQHSGWAAAVAAAALLSAFVVFLAADRNAGEGCTCFGRRRGSSPQVGMARDAALILVLLPAVGRGPGAHRWGVPPAAEPWAAGAAVIAVAAAVTWAFGRDRRVRRQLSDRGRRRSGRSLRPPWVPESRIALDFDLPTVAGGRMRLSQVLAASAWTPIVFVETGCSSCAEVLSRLADHPSIVVIAAGDPDAVAELAARYRLRTVAVALDADGAVADAYRVRATPSACLLDSHAVHRDAGGLSTDRLAVGADAVLALIEATSRPSSPR